MRGGQWGRVAVAALGVGLVLLWALTVMARIDRAPEFWLAAGLFVLPHLYGVYLFAVFVVWCVLPDRRALPALGAAGLLTAAVLWGPAVARWTDDAEGDRLTAMTWNLRRLWGGPDDGGDAFECVVQEIEAHDPDVVVLQEVSRANVQALEARLQMQCIHGTYTRAGTDIQGGLAACARNAWHLLDGSVTPFVGDDWQYVQAEVGRGDRVFNVLAVHLTPFSPGLGGVERAAAGQANQSATLVERVARFRDPTLLAGDFNTTRDFWLHSALRERLVDTWERGGLGLGATARMMGWLPLRIDYIYASNAFGVRGTSVSTAGCSDHRAVISTLVLRDSHGPRGEQTE